MRDNIIDRTRERSWVASLAADATLLNLELISIGATYSVDVEPSAVFGIALQKNSKGIIIIHSHPNHLLEPSEEDDHVTELMIAVGDLIKCPLLDHMIINEEGYYSYLERGRIKIMQGNINLENPAKQVEYLKDYVTLLKLENEKLRKKMERMLKKSSPPKKKKTIPAKKKPVKKARRGQTGI